MNFRPFPSGLCVEGINVWYADEKPRYIEQLRKANSFTIAATSRHVKRIESEGAKESIKQLDYLKGEIISRDEKEKKNLACALLNLVGSALYDGSIGDIVINVLKAGRKKCIIEADSYFAR